MCDYLLPGSQFVAERQVEDDAPASSHQLNSVSFDPELAAGVAASPRSPPQGGGGQSGREHLAVQNTEVAQGLLCRGGRLPEQEKQQQQQQQHGITPSIGRQQQRTVSSPAPRETSANGQRSCPRLGCPSAAQPATGPRSAEPRGVATPAMLPARTGMKQEVVCGNVPLEVEEEQRQVSQDLLAGIECGPDPTSSIVQQVDMYSSPRSQQQQSLEQKAALGQQLHQGGQDKDEGCQHQAAKRAGLRSTSSPVAVQTALDERTVLEHLRGDRTLPPELWPVLALTHACHRVGRDGLYHAKPASPSAQAARMQQGSHVELNHFSFPQGNEAALAEWPLHRRRAQGLDERQGRTSLFQTLQWAADAYAGGKSSTCGDAWLESRYKQGRRKPPPCAKPRPSQDVRTVLSDLDGHLSPEARAASTEGGTAGSSSSRQVGMGSSRPTSKPNEDVKSLLRDKLDSARGEVAAAPPTGRRRCLGPEAARGRSDLFPVLQHQQPPQQLGTGVQAGDHWLDRRSRNHTASRAAGAAGGAAREAAATVDLPAGLVTRTAAQSKRVVPGVRIGNDMKALLYQWGPGA